MARWKAWLMKDGKRDVPLLLNRDITTLTEVQDFFRIQPIIHPELNGEHIEFEEIEVDPLHTDRIPHLDSGAEV